MTVEVLGAVLGTAIQGQIVGMASAPCIPGPGDPVPNMTNVSTADGHNGSLFVLPLDHTVNRRSSVRVFDRQRKYGVYCLTVNRGLACLTCVFIICFLFFLPENGLYDRLGRHLLDLHPLCCRPLLRREGAKR